MSPTQRASIILHDPIIDIASYLSVSQRQRLLAMIIEAITDAVEAEKKKLTSHIMKDYE